MVRETLLAGGVKGGSIPRLVANDGLPPPDRALIQSRTRRLVHPNFLTHSNPIPATDSHGRCGPPIIRWTAPKDRLLSLRMIFRPASSRGSFVSISVLLCQPDVFSLQSRCERIDHDCPWPEWDCCVLEIGMDKTPRARLNQSPIRRCPETIHRWGLGRGVRNRSPFHSASQKCFPNHAQARTDAGLRPL
jgi:hypothetical protein